MRKNFKQIYIIFFILIIILSLVGCGESYEDDDVKYLLGVALQKMQEDVDKKDEIVVIDARSEEEYRQGHIKHAVNIPQDELESNIDYLKTYKDDPFIIYLNTAEEAEKVGQILYDNGIPDVSNADGVSEYDYPLFKYNNIFPDEMLEKIKNGSTFLIDARPREAYEEGHIEGALSIPAGTIKANKNLLPKDKNADIITYCFKGNNSAVGAQELIDLGYRNVSSQLYGTMEYEYDLVK